jgi:dCTP deaminase
MYISDGTIMSLVASGRLGIDPFDPGLVQPASVDCLLGRQFKRMVPNWRAVDPMRANEVEWETSLVPEGEVFVLRPGDFVLGHTVETYRFGAEILGRVEGKSSIGRLGLLAHVTAGFVDPGFEGQITLEFASVAPNEILLRPGMKIAQMSFAFLDQPAQRPYGSPGLNSKYKGQMGAVVGSYHLNYPEERAQQPAA